MTEPIAEWHWGDDANTEQHLGTPGECAIPTCVAPRPTCAGHPCHDGVDCQNPWCRHA